MIIDIGNISHRYSFLICLNKQIDEKAFLKTAKVKKGTYAGDLIEKLYDRIFYRSLDLKMDYERYYKVEYRTFMDYVDRRYLFGEDVIKKLNAIFSKYKHIIYFHPSYTFLEDEYGLEFLRKLLEPGRRK
jgi:hypothetical protein